MDQELLNKNEKLMRIPVGHYHQIEFACVFVPLSPHIPVKTNTWKQ